MISWGATVANVSASPRCTVNLAYWYPRDDKLGCLGVQRFPGHPGFCLDRTHTFRCVLNTYGAYACSSHADFSPLRGANARVSQRGTLSFDARLQGPPTPLLAWQRAYSYVNGFIYPWTNAGTLRSGLSLRGHLQATCEAGSEESPLPSALRCNSDSLLLDPCFPQRAGWTHGGVVAACPEAPGATQFDRMLITRE
jgi:hypothetical protein